MQTKLVVVHHYNVWLHLTLTWLYNQIRLLPSDIESHVVVERLVRKGEFPIANLHVHDELPAWRRVPERALRRLGLRPDLPFVSDVARRVGADVLHSHFGEIGWEDLGAARRANTAHVVTFYGADVNATPVNDARWYGRYRALFERVDRVLCEGPHMAGCIAALGCPEARIRVHPLGIETERFPFVARRRVGDEPLRVLIAGVFREKKGFSDALVALGLLKRRRPDVRVAIDVIGDAAAERASRVEKDRLYALAAQFGLDVRWRGFVGHTELIRAYYENHVFLSPSVTAPNGDTEGGMPVSILEACCSGMPVVSTTHCDIPHLVPDGVATRLAPERSPDALMDHLAWLADHEDAWEGLGRAAHDHVVRGHAAEARANALADIYRELR